MEKLDGNIKFSIIIPTYNRAGFIKDTIESVLRQDYANFEIIVVDDGSTDNTEEIVNSLKDARLSYFKKVNEERGAARNYGFRKAIGDYVIFLDSDDFFHCDHLLTLIKVINKFPEINFLAAKYGFLRNNIYAPSPMHSMKEGLYDINFILKGNPFACHFCIRRNNPLLFLFEEDRSLSIMEDWLFLVKNLSNDTIYMIDKTTVTVNDHDDRSMRSANEIIIKKRKIATEWIFQNIEINKKQKHILLGYAHYFYAIHQYLSGDKKSVIKSCYNATKHLGIKYKILIVLLKSILGRKTLHRLTDKLFYRKWIIKRIRFKSITKSLVFYLLYLLGFMYFLRKKNKNTISLLCFHRVTDESTVAWPAMTSRIFIRLINFIYKRYSILRLDEIGKKKLNKPGVVITFDDGFLDFKDNVLKIIEKKGIPVVLSVVADSLTDGQTIYSQKINDILKAYLLANIRSFSIFIGTPDLKEYFLSYRNVEELSIRLIKEISILPKEERACMIERMEKNFPIQIKSTKMMKWQDIIYCAAKGITIGSHSMTHENLDLNMENKTLDFEILQSKKLIEQKINKEIDVFTFPSGKYNETSISYASKAGYKYLLTTDEELYVITDVEKSVLKLPRIIIQGNSFIENVFRIENAQSTIKKIMKKK